MVKKYLNPKGQTLTEFIFVFGFLTFLGMYLMYTWIAPTQYGGVSATVVQNATDRVGNDPS